MIDGIPFLRGTPPVLLSIQDVVLTKGVNFVWWNPFTWFLVRDLYPEIRRWQRNEYPGCEKTGDDGWVHARKIIWKDRRWQFFEFTYPKARFGELSEITGPFKVCRYKWPLNNETMLKLASMYEGSAYDMGDNLDMLISQKLGWYKKVLHIFGDYLHRIWNCSMGAAELVKAGGGVFDREAISPIYYACTPESWTVVQEGRA